MYIPSIITVIMMLCPAVDSVSLPFSGLVDHIGRQNTSILEQISGVGPVLRRRLAVIVAVARAGVLSFLEHHSLHCIRISRMVDPV